MDRATTGSIVFTQRHQTSSLMQDRTLDVNDLELAVVDPIGKCHNCSLSLAAYVGHLSLAEYNSIAAEIPQHFEQPIVESADFHDGP